MSAEWTEAERRYRTILKGRREGESLRALAKRSKVKYQTLAWWASEAKRRDAKREQAKGSPKLLPVETKPTHAPALQLVGQQDPFEVVFPSGLQIRVPATFDLARLRLLIEALAP